MSYSVEKEESWATLLPVRAALLLKIHGALQRGSDSRWPNSVKVSLTLFSLTFPVFMGPQNSPFMEHLFTFQGTSILWNTFLKKTDQRVSIKLTTVITMIHHYETILQCEKIRDNLVLQEMFLQGA